MAGATFKMTGLEDLKRRMRELKPQLAENAVKSSLSAAGNELRKILKPATPFDESDTTGAHIRDEYQVSRSRRHSGPGKMVFTVGVKYGKQIAADNAYNRKRGRVGKKTKTEGAAFYWKFREFGTKRAAAKPFIRPTFQASTGRLTKIIEEKMAKAVARFERQARK